MEVAVHIFHRHQETSNKAKVDWEDHNKALDNNHQLANTVHPVSKVNSAEAVAQDLADLLAIHQAVQVNVSNLFHYLSLVSLFVITLLLLH